MPIWSYCGKRIFQNCQDSYCFARKYVNYAEKDQHKLCDSLGRPKTDDI